jgi:pSer/pThr/pTyr-binding forkhead associated (FHA) protein
LAHLELPGPGGIERIVLRGGRMTIGRDPSNDIALPGDLTASRRHAVLEELPAGWWIGDAGSLNGTWVNGERVEGERPLFPGDEIVVGETRFVYRDEPR